MNQMNGEMKGGREPVRRNNSWIGQRGLKRIEQQRGREMGRQSERD